MGLGFKVLDGGGSIIGEMGKKISFEQMLAVLSDAQTGGAKIEIVTEVVPEIDVGEFDRWIKRGEELDRRADYSGAANIFFTLYKKEGPFEKKIEAGIKLVQQLINASNLDHAWEFLGELEEVTARAEGGEDVELRRARGRIFEKKGWVADCRDKPDDEIELMEKARALIMEIPQEVRVERDELCLLTTEHFIGRALYKRTKMGASKDVEGDLDAAERQFRNNLEGYTKRNDVAAIAFNSAWLARVAIRRGRSEEARVFVEKAKNNFEKAAKGNYSSNIMGHYYRVAAELSIHSGDYDKAFKEAVEALRLTVPKGVYHNGVFESAKLMIQASCGGTSG